MLYTKITINDIDYKARLTARALVDLEKKMGTSPLNIFMEMSKKEDYIPDLSILISIFHASLQAMEHGITLDKAYELYDQMVDEGKSIADLLNIIVEIFQSSGLIPKEVEDKEKRKN